MRADELDFELPPELIAQTPSPDRAASRLMHYRQAGRSVTHRRFADLPRLLRPGDLMIFNNAKVVPARLTLRKETGGLVEGLFLGLEPSGQWRVMLRNAGPNARGKRLRFADDSRVAATILAQGDEGQYTLAVETNEPALQLLARLGRMPLPPYIHRHRLHDDLDELDRDRYQTVYAQAPGSVAAPTAGLHFTPALLDEIDVAGAERAFVTLHVGMGTFKPVSAQTLEQHRMHTEVYSIPPETADALNRAKRAGRRIVAVGTTAARVLESQPVDAPFAPRDGSTDIFIYPPYRWKHVNAMVTNFHLPRSTLIALVAALVGLEEQRRLYRLAIAERYRFFSYGDAMLIE